MPGVELLDEADFASFGIPKGSLGPVDSARRHRSSIADRSLEDEVAWGVGANENDYHLIGAMPGRDFEVDAWADLVVAQPGDGCPECGGELKGARGIEVSQVFQLGTKYSESMGATFLDENGAEQPFVMGCYGVGVSRSLAAVIEQHNDENGIVWPISVAPLEVAVLPLIGRGRGLRGRRAALGASWPQRGVEVVIDDRDERAGVKFNDADLIGWPFQVVVGKKGLAEGVVELKVRATGERTHRAARGGRRARRRAGRRQSARASRTRRCATQRRSASRPRLRAEARRSTFGGHGAAVREALHRMRPVLGQELHLVERLDSLRNDVQVEHTAQVDEGTGDRRALAVATHVAHERLGDLERLDREPLQVAHRRVARAEVVDRDADAELPQQLQSRAGRVPCRAWRPSR